MVKTLGEAPGLPMRGIDEGPTPGPFQERRAVGILRGKVKVKVNSLFPPIEGSISNIPILEGLEKTMVRALQDFHVASVGNKMA